MELFILPTNKDLIEVYKNDTDKLNQKFSLGEKNIDSGFDLYVPEPPEAEGKGWIKTDSNEWLIYENSTVKIPLGVKMIRTDGGTPEDGTYPFCIYPRSSISKYPLRLANNVGIIDAGYRGELIAAFDNISNENYILKPGTRLVQICRPDLLPFPVRLSDTDFNETSRGAGAFGSTGV